MRFMKFGALCLAAALTAAFLPLSAAASDAFTYVVLEDGTAEIVSSDLSASAVEIPAEIDGITVSSLASACFADHTALKTVVFPESLTTIKDNAFEGCTALETIEIPETIITIGDFVFEGCTSLTAIEVADTNPAYCDDNGVLYSADKSLLLRYPAAKADTSYTIAPECTTISPWAFTECSALQSLDMTGVTAIGADAFFCATSLQTVTLSEGLTNLIGATFAYCANLRKLTLPSTLKIIGDKCFYGCVSLSSVTLPDGLVQIGEMAFYGCVQLKELTVPASVRSIGDMGVGYSVNPETNENAVISGFTMKTDAGSKAFSYARSNDIACSASYTPAYLAKWGCIILLIAAVIGVVAYFVYFKRKREEKIRQKELAAEQAAKRQARRERKANKK